MEQIGLRAALASGPRHRYSNFSLHGQPSSLWAFSSGGERFPDTEEVTSSNLVTPTTKDAGHWGCPVACFLVRRVCRGRVQLGHHGEWVLHAAGPSTRGGCGARGLGCAVWRERLPMRDSGPVSPRNRALEPSRARRAAQRGPFAPNRASRPFVSGELRIRGLPCPRRAVGGHLSPDWPCASAPPSFYRTSAPKGRSDSLAILKSCTPKGAPTTVTHQTAPRSR